MERDRLRGDVPPLACPAGSQVQIALALRIDRKTIRKYVAPALAEGLCRHLGSRSTSRCGESGANADSPSWSTRVCGH